MGKLKDEVVIITGASSGIGRATALELADRGAKLVLAARREQPLEKLARECRDRGGDAVVVPTDVREPGETRALVQRAFETYGRIDVLFNNAGVAAFGSFEDVPPEVFRKVLETNLFGCVHCARAVLPVFREQGHGTIINNISVYGRLGAPYLTPYVASKFAIHGFSESLRQELLDENIDVCALFPAAVDTPFYQHAANYTGQEVQPAPPIYGPDKVARAVVKLIKKPRAEHHVGSAGRAVSGISRLVPGLYDRPMRKTVEAGHFRDTGAPPHSGSVFDPMPQGTTAEGGWRDSVGNGRARKIARVGLTLVVPALLGWWVVSHARG